MLNLKSTKPQICPTAATIIHFQEEFRIFESG